MEDKAYNEWLESLKESTKKTYIKNWKIWIQYCTEKGLATSGDKQLEQIKKDRLSMDQTVKFRIDNEIPLLFKWLKTEYKGRGKKPLSEASALSVTSTVRSFFKYHRYGLQVRGLPSSEKIAAKFVDHAFDIFQFREIFQHGDLYERTVLAVGKDLWLRAGDFARLPRDLIETAIKREEETAAAENRETDIVEFELTTEKEKEPASCHLSRETVVLIKEYLKTAPPSKYLFGKNSTSILEDTLNDILKRLSEKAKITLTGRVRWHCLRKFGITLMHGKVTEPVLKYMVGKHISKDLRTYIQNNKETYKAFKMLEASLNISKVNMVETKMSSELEALRKELERLTLENLGLKKLLMDYLPKEKLAEFIKMEIEPLPSTEITMEQFTEAVQSLGKKEKQKELEELLKNNNNNH